jgi:eukaryotic-like serine/threonine-protein kinase
MERNNMIIAPGIIIYDESNNEYKVLEFIGNGAMGSVYKIQRNNNGAQFALKTLRPNFINEMELKAFLNEAAMALKIQHSNVIRYYFINDGTQFEDLPPYIIMEYAGGGTLAALIDAQIKKKEFLQNVLLVEYYKQMILGMRAINNMLVHRDIKPDNILISGDVLKISDFGLSKIVANQTRTSTFKGFGAVGYMAPEAWKFEKNDIQMDIYSLGIVFYELATLQHPYNVTGNSPEEWEKAHLLQAAITPTSINHDLTSTLCQLILKMLEKKKADRFQNWDEVEDFFKRDSIPLKTNPALINSIIKARMEKDQKLREEQLKRESEIKKRNEHISLIKYQFENSIINKVTDLIEDLNNQYIDSNVSIRRIGDGFTYQIVLPSKNIMTIEIKPLFDEEFFRERIVNDFGRNITVKELRRPEFLNRKILAWGNITSSTGNGNNILLLEKPGEVYGEWLILTNRNQATSIQPRYPEPFPFRFDELEKEINLVNAYHIYTTSYEQFNIDLVARLIQELI